MDLVWKSFVIGLLFDIVILIIGLKFIGYKIRAKFERKQNKKSINIEVGNEMHVMPVNDIVAHTPEDNCACSPKSIPVPREDGSYGWVVTHNAADGRH